MLGNEMHPGLLSGVEVNWQEVASTRYCALRSSRSGQPRAKCCGEQPPARGSPQELLGTVRLGPGLGRARDLLEAGEEVPAVASLAPFHVSEEVQPAVVQVTEPLPQQQDGG